ncbi:MAG: DUF1800 domain-containing protein [Halioglobus sp.]|nr:DUF1800 domain-containing protein [Halioglobus sp.]
MYFRTLLFLVYAVFLVACGGGGGSSSGTAASPAVEPTPPPPPPPVEPTPISAEEATRFLSQATFGPNAAGIEELVSLGMEQWLLDEFDKPASLHTEAVLAQFPEDGTFLGDNGLPFPELVFLPSDSFWKAAIEGDDQLRQRMAFALSQILVVSGDSDVGRLPQALAHYADILTDGAFGNYRDLLQEVTYSPAMAIFLTYLRNEKADPAQGRVPDENYARELLQLFTIGLVELNADGTPVTTPDGGEVELYDNGDITELAKVFTGLSFDGPRFQTTFQRLPLPAFYSPLVMFEQFHSEQAKQFLTVSIPENTPGDQSIDLALDGIFAHPNVGPFVGRQLIQRFVTSAPSPAYVSRVAAAFDRGDYELPSGTRVGSGERGDLKAVIAAILMDVEARSAASAEDPTFGKLREPVLRFTHWARAFEVNSADAANELSLRNTNRAEALGQQAYRSPSVFNFYRPGYIAPGTETGAAGLTAPELQITTASTVVGYPNFLASFVFGLSPKIDRDEPPTYVANYARQVAVAADPQALLDNLDLLLTHGTLQAETRERITGLLDTLDAETEEDLLLRARFASVLVMTSPEYIVLR